ncbi:MAG: transcription antitermination factor NusB [Bdellovibrionota bacterium]|nr:MAG: transcription antitermination factor NusB [Bdellovibrionota bacterium]
MAIRSRRAAREAVLQVLYACDALDCWVVAEAERCLDHFQQHQEVAHEPGGEHESFARSLLSGVVQHRGEIDEAIARCSTRWSLARMSQVDRNIIRLGAYELLHCDDIPRNVSINEAIELAKRFGADDSPTFVNGVLDKAASLLVPESPDDKEAVGA